MPERQPLLVRILAGLADEARDRRGEPIDLAAEWLERSELGSRLRAYLLDESELLWMAANRLNLAQDEELRELGHEVARSAGRLRHLAGSGDGTDAPRL